MKNLISGRLMNFCRTHNTHFVAAGLLSLLLLTPGSLQADPLLPVCDPLFNESLKDKAVAEAQREIQMNNDIIERPASVLALSCFDQHIKQLAAGAGESFTDDEEDGDAIPMGGAIDTAFGTAFEDYIEDNFPGNDAPEFTTDGDYGDCNRMAGLWLAAKCDTVSPVNFVSLTELQKLNKDGFDPRSRSGAKCTATTTIATLYQTGIDSSSNLEVTSNARNPTGKSGDPAYNYFAIARPDFCAIDPKTGKSALGNAEVCTNDNGGVVKCDGLPAIPTGQVITYTAPPSGLSKNQQYWAFRCINPGCYFDPVANASKIKYSAGGTPPTNLRCTYKPY